MKPDKILLDHGSGGKISHILTADLLLPAFDNPALAMLDDGATLNVPAGRIAFSTDYLCGGPHIFSRWQHRRPGHQWYGERRGHVRRHPPCT
jgi:hydrogenase expression/formation protein HypE